MHIFFGLFSTHKKNMIFQRSFYVKLNTKSETHTSECRLENLPILHNIKECYGYSDMSSWRDTTVTLLC